MDNPFELIEKRLNQIENLLIEIKSLCNNSQNIEPSIKWFDLTELCQYHPSKPSKATVYGWIHLKCIPHYKSGKKLRFLKSEIDTWLGIGKRKTISEIEEDVSIFSTVQRKTRKRV
jgi:excisionase family DNA binding protein